MPHIYMGDHMVTLHIAHEPTNGEIPTQDEVAIMQS